jgi:peptidoglycan/LPS O-acetylase OafA/YrhL
MPAARFRQLDALRFFFALVIVVVHTIGQKQTFTHGAFAVDFFFILSGFVLSHALIGRPVSAGQFAWARLARLYPLHLAALIWMLCVIPPFSSPLPEYSMTALALSATLLQGIAILPVQMWNFPAWSISVELMVNLVLLYPVVKARSIGTAATTVVVAYAATVLAWGPVFDWFNVQSAFGTYVSGGLLRGSGGILLGYLIYEAYLRLHPRLTGLPLAGRATCLEIAVIGALVFSMWTSDSRWNVLGVPLSALLVLQMATVPGLVTRLLQRGPFAVLGDASYSIYLLHVPLFLSFAAVGALPLPLPDTGMPPLWPVYFVLLLVISIASFRYLERPAQRRLMQAHAVWNRKPVSP